MPELKYITNRDDIVMLQTMLGVSEDRKAAEDSGIPEEVHQCYREYRSFYDRCTPGGSLSIAILALICQRAEVIARRDKHEWLYKGWRLRSIGPGAVVQVRRLGQWVPATLQDWNEESRKVRVDLGVDHGETRVVEFNVDDVRQMVVPVSPPAMEPAATPTPTAVVKPKR